MEVRLTNLTKGELTKLTTVGFTKRIKLHEGVSRTNGGDFNKQKEVDSLNERTCVQQNDRKCASKTNRGVFHKKTVVN